MKSYSIQAKISFAVVTAVITVQLTSSFFLSRSAKQQSIDNFNQSTEAVVEQVENGMNTFFTEIKANTLMLSQHPVMDDIDESLFTFLNKEGTITPNYAEEPGATSQLHALFKRIDDVHPSYIDIYLGSKYGAFIVGSNLTIPGGYDPRQRPWYQDAVKNAGKTIITEAYQSTTGGPCLTVARQLANKLGVIAVDVSLDEMTKITNEIQFGETGSIILVEKNGTILANPKHPESNFQPINQQPGLKELANITQGSQAISIDGKKYLAKIITSESLNWTFIGVIEESEVMTSYRDTLKLLATLGTILLIILVIFSIYMARSISRPVNVIINRLAEGSAEVAEVSASVAETSNVMAAGSTQQAASLEETSASLEEMTAMTQNNAANAAQADTSMKTQIKLIDQGVESVDQMNQTIQKIQASSEETAKIIKTIDEIAFQTNLLALNAAVEAARAGEAGKGFAVVAEEVRNLAQRSAEAARNTSTLIEEARNVSQHGVTAAEEVSSRLEEIKDGSARVGVLIDEIATASKEQAGGIEQLNTGVAEMDKVVQRNAANSEESSSASEELSAQARELDAMVSELRQIVNGGQIIRKEQWTSPQHPTKQRPQTAINQKKPERQKLAVPTAKRIPPTAPPKHKPEEVIPLDHDDFEDF